MSLSSKSRSTSLLLKRRQRIRTKLKKVALDKARLTVCRTNKHIYAQIIDDNKSKTIAAASTVDKSFKDMKKTGGNKDAAKFVGDLIAKRAKEKGIETVVFDRSGYLYHGRVKELAESARAAGLKF